MDHGVFTKSSKAAFNGTVQLEPQTLSRVGCWLGDWQWSGWSERTCWVTWVTVTWVTWVTWIRGGGLDALEWRGFWGSLRSNEGSPVKSLQVAQEKPVASPERPAQREVSELQCCAEEKWYSDRKLVPNHGNSAILVPRTKGLKTS